MTITINKDKFYMVTFKSGSFKAMRGWRLGILLKAQNKRREIHQCDFPSDIISAIQLPDGLVNN